MKKFLIILLTGLAMFFCCQLHAAAADVVLYDEGGVLGKSSYDECYAALEEASDKTGMCIGVILGTSDRSDYSIETAATAGYTKFFGNDSDGLLYYMDLKGHDPYDQIVTRGMGQFYYTNSSRHNRIDEMFDKLDPYLWSGHEKVKDALLEFADLVEYYYDKGVPANYYYYDDQTNRYYHLENGEIVETLTKPYIDWEFVVFTTVVGAVIGIIAALITMGVVKKRYQFKSALVPTAYINKKGVEYFEQYDRFVRQHTHRVHIDSGSGGHGGGGGGGGHSSGGFGGGGHHR